jgi:predicted GNAT superfamily acetyltransferase
VWKWKVVSLPDIIIRNVSGLAEYKAVEDLQKEVWEFNERDIVPLTQMIAAKETGGILVGAFRQSTMIGFVYGFVGYEEGSLVVHSHMLAVKPSCQGENLGYRLKLAQREQALATGIKIVTWTFDPLQCLNAHLNIEKLGVLAVKYKVNFYGETSSSLHKDLDTDRLWVRWDLESDRVKRRLERPEKCALDLGNTVTLVRSDNQGMPVRSAMGIRQNYNLSIEIPGNIGALLQNEPESAAQWRRVTRDAFLQAFQAGFLVTDFRRLIGPAGPLGVYILTQSCSQD